MRVLHRFARQWTATCVAWVGVIFVFRLRFDGPLMFLPLLVSFVVVLELAVGALVRMIQAGEVAPDWGRGDKWAAYGSNALFGVLFAVGFFFRWPIRPVDGGFADDSGARTLAEYRLFLEWQAALLASFGAAFVGSALSAIFRPKPERGAGLSLLSDAFRNDKNR